MSGLCQGRVVIVTGAGRGIGRGHALEFARHGARVLVNDLGAEVDGTGRSEGPAGEVVDLIRAGGGEAVANGEDISDWDGAKRMVDAAIEAFGGLDVLVNNAGILRDRMVVNMEEAEWDAVIKVHLRGTFVPMHWATRYWRDRSKAGEEVDARVINTSSASGIYGNVGQTNYGAAKAGIAAMTVISALELARYGVTVNAVAPGALTRMTENLAQVRSNRVARAARSATGSEPAGVASTNGAGSVTADPSGSSQAAEAGAEARDVGYPGGDEGHKFDPASPDNIAPLVVWLGSTESRHVTGRVFNVRGGHISVAEGWVAGPAVDKGARWDPEELGAVIPDLVSRAAPNANMQGERA
ncbi:MAG: SDR family NAD(P)-dependent oxidoreductase [Acidimicrobiales bacterium]